MTLLDWQPGLTASMLVGVPVPERTMDLGRTPTAAGAARHWLAAELDDLTTPGQVAAERLEQAQLMISELVANVVLHTTSNAVASVGLVDGRIVVTVGDLDPAFPTLVAAGKLSTAGRGLRIVDELADDWGVTPLPSGGKAAWFSLPAR